MRTYAWGSRTAIADFTGGPSPTAHPEAELWFGAHPGDPAWLETDAGEQSLLDAVRADPEGQLGAAVRERFGDTLPFLMKVLAADEPLSLQAHPSTEQAVEGFAREERIGIPVSSPIRNYRDRSHKPELLVALGTFEALAGFRPAAKSVELMRALAVSDLDPFVNLLAGPAGRRRPARAVHHMDHRAPTRSRRVGARRDRRRDQLCALRESSSRPRPRTVLELGERYPGDAGVLASLLLNRLTLRPGEGIYLPAGNLHAYLHGVGIEVMANSDNVLRGGLTPKHVDVPELLRVLDFTPASEATLRPKTSQDGMEIVYETPAPEFSVSVLGIDGELLGHEVDAPSRHDGPQILLCTEGSAVVHAKSSVVTLERGARGVGVGRRRPDQAGRRSADQAVPRNRGHLRCRPRAAHGRSLRPCSPTRVSPSRSSSAS